MKKENRFYLYRHIRPDKDQPFYIGIGEKYRATNFINGRNKYWRNIFELNLRTIEVDVIEEELAWKQACEKEIWWISFYGRADLKKGPLCNLTDGGEGGFGRKNTPEQIAAKSKIMKEKGDRIRACRTPEGVERIRQSSLRRIRTEEEKIKIGNAIRGKKKTITDKFKKYMISQQRGGSHTAIKVINTETKIVYNCIMDAADSIDTKGKYLARKLKGERKNDTPFIYLTDYNL